MSHLTNQSLPPSRGCYLAWTQIGLQHTSVQKACIREITKMLPRSSVCLLKGVNNAMQGLNRGVATVMADLPEEHVSFDRQDLPPCHH